MKTFKLFLVLLLAGTVLMDAAIAAAPTRTERVPAMREPIYRQLSTAREKADAEDFAGAMETLDRLSAQSTLNSYERAMTWNLIAFVHYSRQDNAAAMNAYRKVLEQKPIPESLELATLYSLAQLNVVAERYREALDMLERWFARVSSPNASARMLLGQVHYQLGNYAEARTAILQAVNEAQARNEVVSESWYLMLRAIHYAEKDYRALAGVLEKLATLYPKREYWVQLSAVYGELGDEQRQLATLETAWEQKMLEQENEYVMLAQLLLANGVPYKAGKVLQAGIDAGTVEEDAGNLRLLADAWVLAKENERSVDVLERAAGLVNEGDFDLRLAQVLLEMERFDDALNAAQSAIRKGGLDKPSSAHMVAGLALFNLDRLEEAQEAFGSAAAFEDAAQAAGQWMEYVEQERERRLALKNALSAGLAPGAGPS